MDSDLDESPEDFERNKFDKFKLKNFVINKGFEEDENHDTLHVSDTSMTNNKRKKSSIVISNTYVLVKWLEIDSGKTTVCHINHITNEEPNNVVERGVYLVKFSNKSKGGPYEAKVLAIGTKDQCNKIQALNSKGSKSEKIIKSLNDKTVKKTTNDTEFINKKYSELQAVIDCKNIELENSKREYQLMEEKFNNIYNSFSKFLKVKIS